MKRKVIFPWLIVQSLSLSTSAQTITFSEELESGSVAGGYRREDLNMDGVTKYAGSANERDLILRNIGGSEPTYALVQQSP